MKRYNEYEDDALVLLYRDGCNEAFDTLLIRYDAYIHTYIRFATADEDEIEDIFQDTFIKVMTTIRSGGYTPTGKFKQWLTRITHNLIMDHFRSRKQMAKFTPLTLEGGHDLAVVSIPSDERNGEESIIYADQLEDLATWLDRLPPEQREVVRLRYWEDMSFKEIADQTGVSINTALGRMRYALNNLRKHLLS